MRFGNAWKGFCASWHRTGEPPAYVPRLLSTALPSIGSVRCRSESVWRSMAGLSSSHSRRSHYERIHRNQPSMPLMRSARLCRKSGCAMSSKEWPRWHSGGQPPLGRRRYLSRSSSSPSYLALLIRPLKTPLLFGSDQCALLTWPFAGRALYS